MKKVYNILSLFLGGILLLTGCSDDTEFTLEGTLGTKKGEKILVVFDDPITHVDTIIPREGKFEYNFTPDTITLFRLVNKAGNTIPVFADKGWKVTCKGTFQDPILKGNSHNQDYADFLADIKKWGDNQDTIQVAAEAFIRSHPHSFASAYLIDRYFIQVPNPDKNKVSKLIAPLNGEVKDSRILNVAMKSIATEEKTSIGYYSLRDRNKKYISWSTRVGQCILINFWASWEPKSVAACDSLRALVKKLPPKSLKVFNISLDYNKEQWLKHCKPDDDNWIEICSLEGWETAIAKQNNIISLPSNILVNDRREVITRDIYSDSLTKEIKRQNE